MDNNDYTNQPLPAEDNQGDPSQPSAYDASQFANQGPIGGQSDDQYLPPPDEIPADEHYLQLQSQFSGNNPAPGQPQPNDQPLAENTQMPPNQPTETSNDAPPLPPIVPAPEPDTSYPQPEQLAPNQPNPMSTEHDPGATPYGSGSLPNTQQTEQSAHGQEQPPANMAPADSRIIQPPEQPAELPVQPETPQPEPAAQSQSSEQETNPQTESQQQVPWWELHPEELDDDAAYRDQLPPKPGSPGNEVPSIHNFKRRGPQQQSPDTPVETTETPSSLDFALPTTTAETNPAQAAAGPAVPTDQQIGSLDSPVNPNDIASPPQTADSSGIDPNLPETRNSQPPGYAAPEPIPETLPQAPAEAPVQVQPPAPHTENIPAQQPEHGTFQLPAASGQDQSLPQQEGPANNLAAAAPEQQTGTTNAASSLKARLFDLLAKFKKFNYKPVASAAIVGILIFGIFNSQVIIGQVQYLTTPSGGLNVSSGTAEADAPVGSDPKIIIPRINVDVPVVYDEPSFAEEKVQKALERGVVHYGNTATPGQKGNNVIVGHSSNNWWDSGKYKFAFILIDKLEDGDEIVLHYEGKRYVYEVFEKKVIEPTDVSVLAQTEEPILTLITCTPPGTSWQRLIVQARQVSPDPSENVEAVQPQPLQEGALPGDSYGGGFFQFLKNLF